MTFEYKIIPLRSNTAIDSPNEIKGFAERRKTVARKLRRERRKHNRDRRSSIRDGVIVNLSSRNDRRNGVDRRRL